MAKGMNTRHRGTLKRMVPRLLLNSLVLAASIGGAVALAELAVRFMSPQQLILKRPDIWMPDDTLGWVHRPNVTTTINTAERTVNFLTDARGFRIGERAQRSWEDSFRILLLGDSFMEALQVEYEESLSGLLEGDFGLANGRPVMVRNTAVGGWDPPQYLLQARRSLAEESFESSHGQHLPRQ